MSIVVLNEVKHLNDTATAGEIFRYAQDDIEER
jgi:hypothetical protein